LTSLYVRTSRVWSNRLQTATLGSLTAGVRRSRRFLPSVRYRSQQSKKITGNGVLPDAIRAGRLNAAEARYRHALVLAPTNGKSHHNHGLLPE
jgi:hypothetical protein